MKLNWNFWRSGGVQSENPSVGEIRIFPGTTPCAMFNTYTAKKKTYSLVGAAVFLVAIS